MHRLPVDPQRFAARHEDACAWVSVEDRVDQIGTGIEEMFAVVQDQQHRTRTQVASQCGGLDCALALHSRRFRDRPCDAHLVPHRGQLGQDHVGARRSAIRLEATCQSQCQRRLARPAGTGDRHDAMGTQQGSDLIEVGPPADQPVPRRGKGDSASARWCRGRRGLRIQNSGLDRHRLGGTSERHRGRTRLDVELSTEEIRHLVQRTQCLLPLPFPQMVPDQRQVRLLVEGVSSNELLVPTGSSQQLQVAQPKAVSMFLRPGLVEVVGQQGSGVARRGVARRLRACVGEGSVGGVVELSDVDGHRRGREKRHAASATTTPSRDPTAVRA